MDSTDTAGVVGRIVNWPSDVWWERDGGMLWVRPHGSTRAVPAPVPPASGPAAGGINRFTFEKYATVPHPRRITIALDYCAMSGPEVDEALGVADAFDTVVDSWEAGTLVPTETDMRRLATLTGYAPGWFYYRTPPPELDGHMFICGPGGS